MERVSRNPFEGVLNVIQFNWHFFLIGFLLNLSFTTGLFIYTDLNLFLIVTVAVIGLLLILLPIVVSYYVYDRSGFYQLDWLTPFSIQPAHSIANITAGFDETSNLIEHKFKICNLTAFDFYNPKTHTEISIERARKKYKIYPGTSNLVGFDYPLLNAPFDFIFVVFAAHEIRNVDERIRFFQCLRKSIAKNGKIIVVEHLRDLPNLIAYSVGAFHFYSGKSWKNVFRSADLILEREFKMTPFISVFSLYNNVSTS